MEMRHHIHNLALQRLSQDLNKLRTRFTIIRPGNRKIQIVWKYQYFSKFCSLSEPSPGSLHYRGYTFVWEALRLCWGAWYWKFDKNTNYL